MNILEENIGYRFRNPDLLEEALRHASTAEKGEKRSYQRLEYLGDAVLNLCIAEEMYRIFPACLASISASSGPPDAKNRSSMFRFGMPAPRWY